MLLIIGLDGADWNIFEPMMARGELPHLAALRQRGAWGPLRSTIRPESSTAWSTFATGVNPGRHAIFGFASQRPDAYAYDFNTAATLRAPTFWQWAAEQGQRLLVCNVPMTYPPQPFPAGYLVAGMLTPSLRSPFTHPPSLRAELLRAVPNYAINIAYHGTKLEKFLRKTLAAIRARQEAALWLLRQKEWDAAIIAFTASDRLQHYTLHLLTPEHPLYDEAEAERLSPLVRAAFQALDEAVGSLVAEAGPEATVMLLSDHGFAPCARRFYPNTWLEQQKLLTRRSGAASGRPRRLPFWLRRLKQRTPGLRALSGRSAPFSQFAAIDWPQTKVVYSPAGGLRFNIRGREPQGVLSREDASALATDLIPYLLELSDPLTGEKALEAVFRREELYHGPYVERAPDLILEPRRDTGHPAHNIAIPSRFAVSANGSPFTSSQELTGNHALDGIFLAAGPGIEPATLSDARLIDLAPTILHALGLPVPVDMEGQVLALWSAPGTVVRAGKMAGETSSVRADAQPAYSDAEKEKVEERLRSLGYL